MLKTETKDSTRKYPNVIWFPRSKTDLREFREVLKLSKIVQEENPAHFFNDKLLGEKMARIGLINRVGMLPEDYIKSYKNKSTGDVSYITNARMLMRIFRFLGWIRKEKDAKYILTKRGEIHSLFDGDFPDTKNRFNEEVVVLDALKDFAFYSVNDTIANRDLKFKIRPFIWLLYTLSLEPQCIFQLITTCFASRNESKSEISRIKSILKSLREGKSDLEREFRKLGLDANNYSCVHNFYDSAKILVYLGVKLNLIERISNPSYGKRISGNARYLKQASIFYKITDKGKEYLSENIKKRLVYFDEIESLSKDSSREITLILGILNFSLGNKSLKKISKSYLTNLIGKDVDKLIVIIKNKLNIEISNNKDFFSLNHRLSFNFWQSIPYEYFEEDFSRKINQFVEDFIKNDKSMEISERLISIDNPEILSNKIILNEESYYPLPKLKTDKEKLNYISYVDENLSYGGQDRYATRISPTNSLYIVGGEIMINQRTDCFDFIAQLRNPDKEFKEFLNKNIREIIQKFLIKTVDWEKDQHYIWVRNCFRLFGCKAIYSGSSGMLMRADVSIIEPFIGGIEAKSPRENRGSVTSKAIRQADHAKKQLSRLYKKENAKSVAIAIGRRITPQAINEEREVFRPDGAPVMIISDAMLYYFSLRYEEFNLDSEDLIKLFTHSEGHFNKDALISFLMDLRDKKRISLEKFNFLKKEIESLGIDKD